MPDIDLPAVSVDDDFPAPEPKPKPNAPPPIPIREVRTPVHRYVRTAYQSMRGGVESNDPLVRSIGPGVPKIVVTPPLVDRALLLADRFLRSVEAKGHTAIEGEIPFGFVRVYIGGELFDFQIVELSHKVVIQPADKKLKVEREIAKKSGREFKLPHQRNHFWSGVDDDRRPFDQWAAVEDGRLCIEIIGFKKFYDRFSHFVENDMAVIVAALEAEAVARAEKTRLAAEKAEKWERERPERERAEAERRERELVEERRRFRKRRRRELLLSRAQAQDQARRLREYLPTLESLHREGEFYNFEVLIRELREMIDQGTETREKVENVFGPEDLFED